jgi:Tfp pilus assembly protein PilF
MSVILDALRKARGAAPSRAAAPRPSPGIPAGLRVGSPAARKPKKPTGTRWPMLGGIVVLAAVVWAGVTFGPRFLQRSAAPAGTPRAITTTATNTPPPPDAAVPPAEQAQGQAPSGAAAETAAETPATPAETPADSLAPTIPAGVSINEMLERIKQPPPIAPRAMPTPRGRSEGPAAARGAAAGRRGAASGATPAPARPAPSRPPLPAAPPAAVTAPAVTATAPTPVVNHFDLAVRYHSLGNFEQALTHYTAALQAEEFNVEARNNLGLLYHERGLTTEAIEQFRRAILINPSYLRARSNLAVVLMNAGRLAEARAELRAAMAIDPRNVDLLVNMALVDKADRQPELAKETLIKAIGIQPSHAAAHYNLAVLYDEVGELARAQEHYASFLKYAGPEFGERLSDVQRRLDALAPKLAPPR